MDVLLELDYTQEFLQSCNFNVDVLAYELAEYRHVGFCADNGYSDINAYVFLGRAWTFNMYASDDGVYFMFYNGFLVREYWNVGGYSGQTLRCCNLYINSISINLVHRIFTKNYLLTITKNHQNTVMLREAIKSNKFPDVFYNFDSMTSRRDFGNNIDFIINKENVNYIESILIYDDVLPDSLLEHHDFKYEFAW